MEIIPDEFHLKSKRKRKKRPKKVKKSKMKVNRKHVQH